MKLYTYAKCGTCRKAVAWLRERNIEFKEIPIRETPPTKADLKKMLGFLGGDLRRIFNTSGLDYRAMNLKDGLPTMTEEDAFNLLNSNGNLVKRPFLLTDQHGAVGFKEEEWQEIFD
ncbi:MAG: arsenate reductase family protein [Verrucomicrobiae bacterium]|nr:arsenate reductase family protein [Verrucomicrobiae bacterium]